MKYIFHIFSFVIFYMTIGFLGIHAQERLYTSHERGGSENGVVGKCPLIIRMGNIQLVQQ